MTDRDFVKLLFGPYRTPALKRGDSAACMFRDAEVVVTGWTNGRIPWPRCRVLDGPGGGSGLLVDEELARAVRHESAAAVGHWWRVSHNTVRAWRIPLVPFPDGCSHSPAGWVLGIHKRPHLAGP
jgi:hypothetical protein